MKVFLSVHFLKSEFLGHFRNCCDLIDYGDVGYIMPPSCNEMAGGSKDSGRILQEMCCLRTKDGIWFTKIRALFGETSLSSIWTWTLFFIKNEVHEVLWWEAISRTTWANFYGVLKYYSLSPPWKCYHRKLSSLGPTLPVTIVISWPQEKKKCYLEFLKSLISAPSK